MTSGHPVDAVVDEEDGDVLATVGGVNDFRGADGGEIAVTLVGDDHRVRIGALHGSRNRGRASVSGLHVAGIEIVVGKDGTADGTDEDGVVLNVEFLESFGDQLVGDAVSAVGAVACLVL